MTRWGIAGPGRFAATVAADLALADGAELVAVGSRSAPRAEAFARAHGVARAHGSYRALLADDGVDVVWVTTPHPQHRALALEAIAAGKAVVVEKAFTATLAGAEEVVAAARSAGVLCVEAMWTRFLPAHVRLRELVAAGTVGEVRGVEVAMGFPAAYDPADRLWAAELGGGPLLDLGPYAVALAVGLLGPARIVEAVGRTAPNGVEATATLELGFAGGATARAELSFEAALPGSARVTGTDGTIEVPTPFHHPAGLVLRGADAAEHVLDLPPRGVGYLHLAEAVGAALASGETELAAMPHADTLAVMAVLDDASAQLGVARADD